MVQLVGSTFTGAGRPGDFRWMIERDEFAGALFVFNDNEEQFRAFRDDPRGASGCSAGGGNAAIRPYRCVDPPRAAGVPTGADGQGYRELTPDARDVVDEALGVIDELLRSGRYERVIYSAAAGGELGTGIFHVGADVKAYIVDSLQRMVDRPR